MKMDKKYFEIIWLSA